MKLVIDAGIIFTALTGKGITKNIIFSNLAKLFAPEYLFKEIEAHKSRIIELSSISAEEINELFSLLINKIILVPKEDFEKFLEQANSLISDKDDTEYLALSLANNKMPIWSNDEHFKEQSLIRIFNTKELVEEFKSLSFYMEEDDKN